jgi:hypothetical protein
MSPQDLDLRAYSFLLDDIRSRIGTAFTIPTESTSEPTHRLEALLSARIKLLTDLQAQLAYTALKIKHLKEDIGTFPQGLPR